jgi:hypothetical protein
MEQHVEVDDFTVETTGESGEQAAPPSDILPAEPPVETPTEPAPDDTPEAAEARPATLPTHAPSTERNPDGTFKAKGKKDPQARIDHVTWEREEARREAARLKAELDALRAAQPATQEPPREPSRPAPQPAGDPTDPEPQEAQFDDYGKFVKAQARWEARQEFREQSRIAAQRAFVAQREQRQHQRLSSYAERMAAVATADPEFFTRLHPEVANLRPTSLLEPGQAPSPLNDLADEVLDSPHAALLLQHFSDHPDDLRRFQALRTRKDLLREFTKLETRVETASAGSVPTTPVLSQAKPPIKPVGSAPPTVEDDGSDDEPLERFVMRENAKEAKAGRRR